jgi:hypothetical protein
MASFPAKNAQLIGRLLKMLTRLADRCTQRRRCCSTSLLRFNQTEPACRDGRSGAVSYEHIFSERFNVVTTADRREPPKPLQLPSAGCWLTRARASSVLQSPPRGRSSGPSPSQTSARPRSGRPSAPFLQATKAWAFQAGATKLTTRRLAGAEALSAAVDFADELRRQFIVEVERFHEQVVLPPCG